MKAWFKKIIYLFCAALLGVPNATIRPVFRSASDSYLAPAHSVALPEEVAAKWVASQIQGMLQRSGNVTQAELAGIQEKVTQRMEQNPWEVGLEWIFHEWPTFEFVLGGGLYTVQFSSGAPAWEYKISVFHLDQILKLGAPLVKTASTQEGLGIPVRHVPKGFRPPSFEEEQDRLLAISIDELHREVKAFSDQTKVLRRRGEMEWYESKRQHFVQWCDRLLTIFPSSLARNPQPRQLARRSIETARRMLVEKKNYSAALASLVKARRQIWGEGKALEGDRVLQMQWENVFPTMEEERAQTEALIKMGRFLVVGGGPVTTEQHFWKRGTLPLDGSSRLIKSQSLVHYASQLDYIFALVATIESIRETQEKFKIYLKKIEALKQLTAIFWEIQEILLLQMTIVSARQYLQAPQPFTRAEFKTFLFAQERLTREGMSPIELEALRALSREADNPETPEEMLKSILITLLTESKFVEATAQPMARMQARLQEMDKAILAAQKGMVIISIREATLEIHLLQQELDHHTKRLARLHEEEKYPFKLRPEEKLQEQIKESESIVSRHPIKIAEFRAAIDLGRNLIQQIEAEEKAALLLTAPLLEKRRDFSKKYFYFFVDTMRSRREEWRVRSRDHLIRAFTFLFPEYDVNKADEVPQIQSDEKPKRRKKIKPPKRVYSWLTDKQWEPELQAVRVSRYREAQGALNEAYRALVKVLYDQDGQVGQKRDELQDEREGLFRSVIRGLKLKGFVRQARAVMAEEKPYLPTLWRVVKKMEDQMAPPTNGTETRSPSELNGNPLRQRVETLKGHVAFLGKWYENKSRKLAMAIFDEFLAALPEVSSANPEDFPPITFEWKNRVESIFASISGWQRKFREDRSGIGSKILEQMPLMFARFGELVVALREQGEGPFPAGLIGPYQEFHRELQKIRAKEDPRIKFNLERLPPLKKSKMWKKLEEGMAELEALLEPPEVSSAPVAPAALPAKGSSPLLKRPEKKAYLVARFKVSAPIIKEKKRVWVAIEEHNTEPKIPLFQGLLATSAPTRDFQQKLDQALRKLFLDPEIGEAGWERSQLVKKISVWSGLDKMADFDGEEIRLDEDLFGNAFKKIPFTEGLLLLELQLKLDHLEAIGKREGVPPTPQQLAVEKLQFLRRYLARFLAQPLEVQKTQLTHLERFHNELDQGGFAAILKKAQELYQEHGDKAILTVLDILTTGELVDYLKLRYPEILTRGIVLLTDARVPLLLEVRFPSVLLPWHSPSRGNEWLRLGQADLDDIRSFYSGKGSEVQSAWVSRLRAVMEKDPLQRTMMLVKVADRAGTTLAWALVTRVRDTLSVLPEEAAVAGKERQDRLVITDFDLSSEPKVRERALVPLLLFAASLTQEWHTGPNLQLSLRPDQLPLVQEIPCQKEIPRGTFPAEDFLDEDAEISGRERELPKEIFVDAPVLLGKHDALIDRVLEDVGFFQMLRSLMGDMARFRSSQGSIFKDAQNQWHYNFASGRLSENSFPLYIIPEGNPQARLDDLISFYNGPYRRAVFVSSNQIWVVDKEADDFTQLPLIEELGFDHPWDELKQLLVRFQVFDEKLWQETQAQIHLPYLKEAIERLEQMRPQLKPEKSAALLAWLTGSRLRVIDTQGKPEWIQEEYAPYLGEEFDSQIRTPFALMLMEHVSRAAETLIEEGENVKKCARKVGEALEELQLRLKRFRKKNEELERILRDLENVKDWTGNLYPNYRELPRPLRVLNEFLRPLGILTSYENEAVSQVHSAVAVMKAAHFFLTSHSADEQIQRWKEALQKEREKLERTLLILADREQGFADIVSLPLLDQAI